MESAGAVDGLIGLNSSPQRMLRGTVNVPSQRLWLGHLLQQMFLLPQVSDARKSSGLNETFR